MKFFGRASLFGACIFTSDTISVSMNRGRSASPAARDRTPSHAGSSSQGARRTERTARARKPTRSLSTQGERVGLRARGAETLQSVKKRSSSAPPKFALKECGLCYECTEPYKASGIGCHPSCKGNDCCFHCLAKTYAHCSHSKKSDNELACPFCRGHREIGEDLKAAGKKIRRDTDKSNEPREWNGHPQYDDYDFVLNMVRAHRYALEWASHRLRDNERIVLEAIRSSRGSALCDASDRLKNDPAIVLEAVRNGSGSLRYASPELKSDRNIVRAMILESPDGGFEGIHFSRFDHTGTNFVNDRDMMLLAVRQNGSSLVFAKQFQNDDEIVLAAVTNEGTALRQADPRLQNDPRIVRAAVTSKPTALEYASPELQNDPSIVLVAVRGDSYQKGREPALKYASEPLKSHRPIILAAVGANPEALQYTDFSSDREIILTAVRKDWNALSFASAELRSDHEILLAAVTQSSKALIMVRKDLLRQVLNIDKEVVLQALSADSNISDDWIAYSVDRREKIFAVLNALKQAGSPFLNDREVALQALETLSLDNEPPAEIPTNFPRRITAEAYVDLEVRRFENKTIDGALDRFFHHRLWDDTAIAAKATDAWREAREGKRPLAEQQERERQENAERERQEAVLAQEWYDRQFFP